MTGKKKEITLGIGLLIIEVALLALFFSFVPQGVNAAIGNPNATVITLLEVGAVFPEVIQVQLHENESITLTPNTTTSVWCTGVLRDYNGDSDLAIANGTLYASQTANWSANNDNNYKYTNSSCVINTSFGSYNGYTDDTFLAVANCTFDVEYYAVAEPWRCVVEVNDSANLEANESNLTEISQLLALGLPDSINYGLVNATYVSDENRTNVTNIGNTALNMSLEGYAVTQGDGLAMNCSYGNVQNISVEYEKYNLTASNAGPLTHAEFDANYTNLSTTPAIRWFNLTPRVDDVADDTLKPSYWRIYVPVGVAGNCTGNVRFGATTADGGAVLGE